MNFKIDLTGIKEFKDALSDLAKTKIPLAVSRAMNDTVQQSRFAVQEQMDKSFSPKTAPYVKSGVRYRNSTPQALAAEVYIDDTERGKGALSPLEILRPQVYGGDRMLKASERRLRRVGYLGPNQYLRPGPGAPLDSYGNISSGQMQRILGWVDAYKESGYNRTAKTNKHYVIPFVGVFRSTGKGTSIPVLIFINVPHYGKRFPFYETIAKHIKDNFLKNLLQAWGNAMLKAGRYGK